MRSGLEGYAAEKLAALRAGLKHRDRAVIVGAVLSFTPIFPACFFGVVLSLLNLVLIHRKITDPREVQLVRISLAIGCLNSLVWLYVFVKLGETFGVFIEHIFDNVLTFLGVFDTNPTERATSTNVSV